MSKSDDGHDGFDEEAYYACKLLQQLLRRNGLTPEDKDDIHDVIKWLQHESMRGARPTGKSKRLAIHVCEKLIRVWQKLRGNDG